MTSRWFLAIPIIFLAFMIGVFNLYDGSVSLSEANSLRHLGLNQENSNNITDVINSVIIKSPQHPPVYFVMLNFWYDLLGSDPGILRLLALFWSILTVAMTYRLGTTLNTHRGGVYASLMAVSSWSFMYYSHEIRQYSLVIFISASLLWLYWTIISRKSPVPIRYWIALFVLSAVSVYTHYFCILVLIAIGLYHLLIVRKDARWMRLVAVEILAGITFIPWLSIVKIGLETVDSTVEGDLVERSLEPLNAIYEFLFFHSNGLWFVLLAIVLIVVWNYRRLSQSQRYGLLMLVFMTISMFAIHLVYPILYAGRLRYIILFVPILAVNVGIGLMLLGRFQKLAIPIIGLFFVAGFYFIQSDLLYDYSGLDRMPPFDSLLREMEAFPGMHEPIVGMSALDDNTNISLQTREYYGKTVDRRIVYFKDRESVNAYVQSIRKVAEDELGFWLLYWSNQAPLDEVNTYKALLMDDFHDCGAFIDRGALQLHFLIWNEIPCDFVNEGNPRVVYDNDAILSNVYAQPMGDTLDVYVLWNDVPFEEYGVSLQLFDAEENRITQDDFVVIEGFHHSQLPWEDMPVGDYNLHMILYNLSDISSIGGQLYPDDSHFDRSFSIGTISVHAE